MAFPGMSKASGHAPEGVNIRMLRCIISLQCNFSQIFGGRGSLKWTHKPSPWKKFYVLFEHCFTFELFGLMTAKLKYLLTYLLYRWNFDDWLVSLYYIRGAFIVTVKMPVQRLRDNVTLISTFSARLTLPERAIANCRSVCLSVCPSLYHTCDPRYAVQEVISHCKPNNHERKQASCDLS